MNLKNWSLTSQPWRLIFLTLASLLLSLVFMGTVPLPTPGLDPSWTIALSKAHDEGLVWGKDITFTFGPLGYLFFGSLIGQNFLEMQAARFLLFFIWIFVSLKFSLRIQGFYLKLASLIILVVIPTIFNTSEAKFILLTLFITLDISNSKQVDNSRSNLKHYLYGVIAIFFLLIKFNFGLLSAVSFIIVLPIKALIAKKSGDQKTLINSIKSIAWLLFGVFSGLIVFFSSLISISPFLSLSIASSPGIITIFVLGKAKWKFSSCSDRQLSIASSIYSIGIFLCLISLFTVLNSDMRDFVVGSLEISSGYSQSMTLVGPKNELFVGLTILFCIAVLAVQTTLINFRNIGFAFVLLIFSLMSFKHGFIRQGPHVLHFAVVAPAYIFVLGSLNINRKFSRKLTVARYFWILSVTLSVAFFFGLGVQSSSVSKYYDLNLQSYISNFSLDFVSSRFLSLTHSNSAQAKLSNQKEKSLSLSRIHSSKIISDLQSKTVDVFPWEVSLIEANHLKWHPAPIFQAYSAYTRWLDRKNLRSYQNNPPDRILYSFNAIDERYPYFEQPQTTLFMLCNYKKLGGSQILVSQSTGEFAVLRRRSAPLCSPENAVPVGEPTSLNWDEKVDLDTIFELYGREPGNLLILKADIKYSLVGKLYNTFFRTPPIYINLFFDDFQPEKHRLVPDTAKSGLVVSSLPNNLKGALEDFEGYDGGRKAKAITFSTLNQGVFSKTVRISFSKIKKQVLIPNGFDTQKYLERYPDVRNAGVDPKKHFVQYGFFEGRQYK